MGFLDNSGDILIDAVLTDAGRERLARGDGSFRIVKYALGDDEINYGLFNTNHPSGSAYQDLEILQTPVLEAPTDNGGALKHKLISIPRNDLLYLPVIKLNEENDANGRRTSGGSTGTFVVAVNQTTENSFQPRNGILYGENPDAGNVFIRLDQGLDTEEISSNRALDDNLVETRYIVEIDNRFGQVVSLDGTNLARPNYVDDDDIASYNFALGVDTDFVAENTVRGTDAGQVISGPRGTMLSFKLLSSLDLNSSNFYFNKLGSSVSMTDKDGASVTFNYIDTYVRIFGATTGRAVDIPVRYIRNQ